MDSQRRYGSAHAGQVLHLAIANGLTDVVARVCQLAVETYYVTGAVTAAPRLSRSCPRCGVADRRSPNPSHWCTTNLAQAALDAGCVGAAAHFTRPVLPLRSALPIPLLDHIPLVAAEILIKQGSVKQGMLQAREVLQLAHAAGNPAGRRDRSVIVVAPKTGNRRDVATLLKLRDIARAEIAVNILLLRIRCDVLLSSTGVRHFRRPLGTAQHPLTSQVLLNAGVRNDAVLTCRFQTAAPGFRET